MSESISINFAKLFSVFFTYLVLSYFFIRLILKKICIKNFIQCPCMSSNTTFQQTFHPLINIYIFLLYFFFRHFIILGFFCMQFFLTYIIEYVFLNFKLHHMTQKTVDFRPKLFSGFHGVLGSTNQRSLYYCIVRTKHISLISLYPAENSCLNCKLGKISKQTKKI